MEVGRAIFERLQVRDMAKAVQVAAAVKDRREVQTEASLLVMDAERAIAKANPPRQGREGGKKSTIFSTSFSGQDSEIRQEEEVTLSRSQVGDIHSAHRHLSDDDYDQVKEVARERSEPLTRLALKNARVENGQMHVGQNSEQMEWFTPPHVIDAARATMGGIDLDPATTATAIGF